MWSEQYVNFHSFQHPHMASGYTKRKQQQQQQKQVSPVARPWRMYLQMQETKGTHIWLPGQDDPMEKKRTTHSSIFPG